MADPGRSSPSTGGASSPTLLDAHALRAWPLPFPQEGGDKEERGRVLVVAGSREIPGAALLAGTAALRAGAGKLVVATVESAAAQLALAIPEARVIALPETKQGGIHVSSASLLSQWSGDAVLLGPGFQHEDESSRFVEALLPQFRECAVVLDALAMSVVAGGRRLGSPVLLTPHAGEMAHLTGLDKEDIQSRPGEVALEAATKWNVIVALKGAKTWIATPGGQCWLHEGGNAGLATSGSGDTLAGMIAGLAARGALLEQATAWGVALHARAGERLAERLGPLGYLARELSAELPRLMHELSA